MPRGIKHSKLDNDNDSTPSSSVFVPQHSISFQPLSSSHNSNFSTTSPNLLNAESNIKRLSNGSSPRHRTNVTFHRYIIVKAPDKQNSLNTVSPFLISRWLLGMVGTTTNIKNFDLEISLSNVPTITNLTN